MNTATNQNATLEHINLTVSDPDATAALLMKIFDWKIRWAGGSMDEGNTVHVGVAGDSNSYIALYSNSGLYDNRDRDHRTKANLNHIGIVVPDLEHTEKRVLQQGLTPESHADYAPGRRFYFYISDGIEIEVISYGS